MKPEKRLGSSLLLALGILTLGVGAYFSLLRPALLPEDLRFTGADPARLDPRMVTWLGIVFRTWRGFIAGFGVLLAAVGGELAFLATGRRRPLIVARSRPGLK